MRNTAEYPITVEECIEALSRASNSSILFGSIEPYALSIVRDYIVERLVETSFKDYLEFRMRIDHVKS